MNIKREARKFQCFFYFMLMFYYAEYAFANSKAKSSNLIALNNGLCASASACIDPVRSALPISV